MIEEKSLEIIHALLDIPVSPTEEKKTPYLLENTHNYVCDANSCH